MSNEDEKVQIGNEIKALMEELERENPDLYEKFKELESDITSSLEENLAQVENERESASKHATQAKRARDAAEQLKRLAMSETQRAVEARKRAEQALEDAEKGTGQVSAFAEAFASAQAQSGPNGLAPAVSEFAGFGIPGRPADEGVATMAQLSTLLIGTSPAFANAIRIQTDAVASGMGNLNAIANQQSHYTLDLAATARAVSETYSANRRPEMHFHLAVNEPNPVQIPAAKKNP
ncbi:RebB family R body protein [Nannocystaceae bacterium ST9]